MPCARFLPVREYPDAVRGQVLEALVLVRDEKLLAAIKPLLVDPEVQCRLATGALASLARLDHDGVADVVLGSISTAPP